MDRFKPVSIFSKLMVRIVVFLAIPFALILALWVFKIINDGEINYRTNIRLCAEYGRDVRQTHLENVYTIANRISSNKTLNGFFLVTFLSSNLYYYRTRISEIITPLDAERHNYRVYVFYNNKSIPRGLEHFYYLDDIRTERINSFIDSEEQDMWILPSDTEGLENSFLSFQNSYTYLRKVFASDKLNYIMAITVPKDKMNSITQESAENESFGQMQIIELKNSIVVDYSQQFDMKQDADEIFEDIYQKQILNRTVAEVVEFEGFPQKVIYVFRKKTQTADVLLIALGLILFFVILVYLILGYVRQISRGIYGCLNEFDKCRANDFRDKIPVTGNDEITKFTEAFNAQIEKIQELLKLTAQQAGMMMESRLKALQQQINPHFVYNTLEILSYRMEACNLDEEADSIVAFAKMLRYNTVENRMFSSIKDEIDHVGNYICIEKLRNKDASINVQVDQNLLSAKVPRFILQPIIENSFTHGYVGRPLNVSLRIQRVGDKLKFEISDDGAGISEEEAIKINRDLEKYVESEQVGIGLGNINMRLFYFYGADYRLFIEGKKDEGFCVRWFIPYSEYSALEG